MQDNDFGKKLSKFVSRSAETVGKYFVAKLITSLIIGIATLIFCQLLNIKPAWLLGIIAGIGNFIPIVGPWIVLIVCGVVAVFQAPINALYIIIFCIGIQAVDQFLLTPLIVGKSIDLSPLLIIVVVTIASMFLGFWGLLFAVPIASIIKIGYTIFIKKKDDDEAKALDS